MVANAVFIDLVNEASTENTMVGYHLLIMGITSNLANLVEAKDINLKSPISDICPLMLLCTEGS